MIELPWGREGVFSGRVWLQQVLASLSLLLLRIGWRNDSAQIQDRHELRVLCVRLTQSLLNLGGWLPG